MEPAHQEPNLVLRVSPLPAPGGREREGERPWERGCLVPSVYSRPRVYETKIFSSFCQNYIVLQSRSKLTLREQYHSVFAQNVYKWRKCSLNLWNSNLKNSIFLKEFRSFLNRENTINDLSL